WNGEKVLDIMMNLADENGIRSRLSSNLVVRTTADELNVQDISGKTVSLVPDWVLTTLKALGLNLDFTSSIKEPVVRSRKRIKFPQRYNRRIAVLLLNTAAELYHQGKLAFPDLPESHEKYLMASPWNGPPLSEKIKHDAELLKSGKYDEKTEASDEFWDEFKEQYLRNDANWQELLRAFHPAMEAQRRKLHFGSVPKSLVDYFAELQNQGMVFNFPDLEESKALKLEQQSLLNHLKYFSLLFLHGKAQVEGRYFKAGLDEAFTFPENPSAQSIAGKINAGDYAALNQINDENWMALSFNLYLPELEMSLQQLITQLQTHKKERAAILRKLGLATSFEEEPAIKAVTELFQQFTRLIQDKLSDRTLPPAVIINLRGTLLNDFESLIEKGEIEGILRTYFKLLKLDRQVEKEIAFYDSWLRKNLKKENLRQVLQEKYGQDEIMNSIKEIKLELVQKSHAAEIEMDLKAGALLGEEGELLLDRMAGNVLTAGSVMFQPGQAIAVLAEYFGDKLQAGLNKILEQQQVEALALRALDPARAPPIRQKLSAYLTQAKKTYAKQTGILTALQSIDPGISIQILARPKQREITDPDMERLGVFHFKGIIYNTESVFKRVSDDVFAAIQLHEALESAGIKHDQAVKIVWKVTGYSNNELIAQAGLKPEVSQRIAPGKSPAYRILPPGIEPGESFFEQTFRIYQQFRPTHILFMSVLALGILALQIPLVWGARSYNPLDQAWIELQMLKRFPDEVAAQGKKLPEVNVRELSGEAGLSQRLTDFITGRYFTQEDAAHTLAFDPALLQQPQPAGKSRIMNYLADLCET
ncbi:hypothetical protein KAR10_08155, partial [bacterium]|nr:hypothetical protein [bacterium]